MTIETKYNIGDEVWICDTESVSHWQKIVLPKKVKE